MINFPIILSYLEFSSNSSQKQKVHTVSTFFEEYVFINKYYIAKQLLSAKKFPPTPIRVLRRFLWLLRGCWRIIC